MKHKPFHQGETRIEKNKLPRYARIPWDLVTNPAVSSDAKMVFAVLAGHAFQGNVAYIGQRRIAELSGFSPSKVNRLMKSLIPTYVDVKLDGPGRRSFYVLKSPVFGQRQGKQEVIVSGPSGVPRFASVDKRKTA